MTRSVEVLKFQGKYPIKMKKVLLGTDANRENEECWEQRLFMYLGCIRLDITSYNPAQIQLIVTKLELMGLTKEDNNGPS